HENAWAITEPSEHKEEILAVIEYLLSDDIQMENSKNGEPSVLENPDVHAVFGEHDTNLADKNLDSLFKNTPATGPDKQSEYADDVIWKAGVEFLESNQDINEFIRVMQEE